MATVSSTTRLILDVRTCLTQLKTPSAKTGRIMTLDRTRKSDNDQCKKAKLLDLSSGEVTANGNTIGAENEFGHLVLCGGTDDLDGPQLYYQLLLTPGQYYELSLKQDFGARVVLFGVGPTPVRVREAEQVVVGERPGATHFEQAGRKAGEAVCEPLSDLHASAEYRRHLAGVLARRGLAEAVARAGGAR